MRRTAMRSARRLRLPGRRSTPAWTGAQVRPSRPPEDDLSHSGWSWSGPIGSDCPSASSEVSGGHGRVRPWSPFRFEVELGQTAQQEPPGSLRGIVAPELGLEQ